MTSGIYRTRLPSIMRYADGTRGSVEVRGRSFSQTISIPSRKGVYTLVVWLEKESETRGFMATNATVFVEGVSRIPGSLNSSPKQSALDGRFLNRRGNDPPEAR